MQIIDDKGLIVEADTPHTITNVIEKSAVLSDGRVLVHWNLPAAQTLARLGYSGVPSPISRSYPYHGRNAPYPHQRTMAEFMTLHPRCFNFSDMGTGKSRAVCWAADYLMNEGAVKRMLIVGPLSILRTVWEADLFVTAPHRTVGIARGDPARRTKIINNGCEVCIINHDGVKSSMKELKKAKFDLIVIDEATAFCNSRTQRWKALNKLLEPHTYLWMLTGTPAANSPIQAYGLGKLVCPERVPQFESGWRDMTMYKVSRFTWIPKPDHKHTVFDALQPAIRIDKRDCKLNLPPVVFMEREFEMEPQQAKYYAHMKKQMLMYVSNKQITAVNNGVLMNKLLQIAAGAVYSDDGATIDFRSSARLNEMRMVIEESSQKVLVFANYKHAIRIIMEFLEKAGIEAAAIDGDTSDDKRMNYIKAFQETSKYKVLVLQPRTAAHGLTLTAADSIVWFTPVSSLETWRQANDRINRIGQVNPMTVVKLVGSPIERRIYKVLEGRDTDQKDLLELFRQELLEAGGV